MKAMPHNELVQKEFVKERGEEKRQGEERPLTNFYHSSFQSHLATKIIYTTIY